MEAKEQYARQNPGLIDQPLKGDWLRYDQRKDDTVWAEIYDLNKHFVLREFNGCTYMLERIPEEGLWGTYYGQGDLQWAWVKLPVWKKWVRKEVLAKSEAQ